jgi:hypothetical protein
MTPEATSETKFALEAFLPLWAILFLGLLLLGVSFWLARRDARFVDRPKLVWPLLLLRIVAVLILLWMLAGPDACDDAAKVQKEIDRGARGYIREHGVWWRLADGSGNVSRWAASHGGDSNAVRLRQVDGAVATILAAQRQLERFGKLPDSTNDGAAARVLFKDSVEGIAKGLELVKDSSQILPGSSAELKPALSNAAKAIENGCLPILREKAAAFRSGKSVECVGTRKLAAATARTIVAFHQSDSAPRRSSDQGRRGADNQDIHPAGDG